MLGLTGPASSSSLGVLNLTKSIRLAQATGLQTCNNKNLAQYIKIIKAWVHWLKYEEPSGSLLEKAVAPTPALLPGNPRDGGAWWAAVHGVAEGRT